MPPIPHSSPSEPRSPSSTSAGRPEPSRPATYLTSGAYVRIRRSRTPLSPWRRYSSQRLWVSVSPATLSENTSYRRNFLTVPHTSEAIQSASAAAAAAIAHRPAAALATAIPAKASVITAKSAASATAHPRSRNVWTRRGTSLADVSPPDADARPYGRRTFLLLVAGGLSSLAWGSWASRILSPLTSGFTQLLADALPVGGWRIYTISGSMPEFDPRTWRLEIGGLVRRPVRLGYDELLALPRAEQVSTFHCVTGWTVRDVHWAGVRFRDLLS